MRHEMRKEINKFKDFLKENSEEKLNISDVRRSFSFTYDDLRTAFEEGGENIKYDDEHGFSSTETFEQWFEKWFKKNYA